MQRGLIIQLFIISAMNVRYSLLRFAALAPAVAAMLLMTAACRDDFGYENIEGQAIAFNITSPGTWHDGMSVDEHAPTTHCTSVRPLSGGSGDKLYLHTIVADNPAAEEATEVSRGTPINTLTKFIDEYPRFSLSGICYVGDYPSDESQNQWTTDYADNLYYDSTSGTPKDESGKLFWPSNGRVKFFAFAPTVDDFDELGTGGSLARGYAGEGSKGSPTLTYTVPTDVTKQIDLMTVCADATAVTDNKVGLEFGHALTAVRIKCGKDMLAGTITEVTIAGVNGTGTQVIGSGSWDTSDPATYTISKEIPLSADKDATDKIHVSDDIYIAGAEGDELTFMLLPQTVPPGATITIKFKDTATETERTLKGSIAGHEWKAGQIVVYTVSPSSINVSVKVELSKKGITNPTASPDPDDKTQTGDTIPYSGVWYDATYKACAEIVQTKDDGTTDTQKIEDIPADKIKFQYKIGGEWKDCVKDEAGLLTIEPQAAYKTMRDKFTEKGIDIKTEIPEFSLSTEKGEPANCYLVDRPGYYSLDLVYGNGKNLTLPAGGTGLQYFPGYDNNPLPANGQITDAADAVLLWQDAPDLIDPNSVGIDGNKLVFHIRKQTLTQGNAVLAVRKDVGGKKVIIWSWHIWVTPYKTDFYSQSCTSTTYLNMTTKVEAEKVRDYKFAKYNLGWCDSHVHNVSRKFRLQAVVDMSAYGGGESEEVGIPGEFTQMEYRGSDAGDNTYYQWGRKDPMLGGIQNTYTPKYKYRQRGTNEKADEFTMENKQLFNQYNQDGYDYRFRKNIGDKLTELHPELDDGNSHGVLIGYTIQHPYMFITNSRMQYVDPASGKRPEGGDPAQTDLGLDPDFNFRGHWHKPWALEQAPYLVGSTDHIMFNAWDASALTPGKLYAASDETLPKWGSTTITAAQKEKYMKTNASDVKKTVFDPCPPGFKVPPIDAFRGATAVTGSGHARTITFGTGGSTDFPITGLRDYALRSNEWKTVVPSTGSTADFDYENFYRTTMPAFGGISFVSTATLVLKDPNNRYQLLFFEVTTSSYTGTSSNSYGLPVRPIIAE